MTLRSALRVVGYDILILFVIANVLYWSIPTAGTIIGLISPPPTSASYHSFIGWRLSEVKSPDFNIEGFYSQRRTVNEDARSITKAYFFGGSTMWGFGLGDRQTIPSHFGRISGLTAENFAQPAYTAHQSLVWLIQILQDGSRPDLVVFYDGVNEIRAKCLRSHNAYSHMREHEFNTVLFSSRPDSFTHHFAPSRVWRREFKNKPSVAWAATSSTAIQTGKRPRRSPKTSSATGALQKNWSSSRAQNSSSFFNRLRIWVAPTSPG
jgi:hypothetical protein